MTDRAIDTIYVGIDVDDPFCRIFAVDSHHRLILRRSIAQEYIWMRLPAANRIVIGIEYRSCVHDLARKLTKAGLEVRLIRFRDMHRWGGVSSGVDYGCAEALCEAVRMGSTRYVPILAPSEQGRAASQRVKALLKRQRSAILNAARTIVDSVDAAQGSKARDDQDVGRRLGAITKTSAFQGVSAALLDVLLVLERNIGALDEVEPRFEVITGDGPDADIRNSTVPCTEPCAVPLDRGSSMQA